MYADPTLMDLAAAYAKRRNGRKTKHAVACDRPGAKAEMGRFDFLGFVVKEDEQYVYYYPHEDDRATFADEDGKGAYTVKSNRTGKPVSAKTYRSWDEAVSASNAINEKLPPLKKRKSKSSRSGAKAKMGKYWVEVNADGKTRTIPVASMNEGLRVLRENATERAALRHSGEGMNDILANAAAGGVLLTAAGRMHKSVSSRPGAKAKMSIRTDDDVYDVLVEASDKGLDRHSLVQQARSLRNAIDPHGNGGSAVLKDARWPQLVRLAEQIKRLPAAYSRPGAKAKSTHAAATPVAVTEAEFAAIAARDAVSKKILGDSQYQITEADRRVRAAGDAAYKAALARHNAWHAAWEAAATDEERARIEAKAKAAEAGMRVYRASRPGAKAKMGRAEDIYRKLSSGSVTLANAKEWERLAVEALRLPDFTPAGTDWSLHELAEEIGAEVLALKSRASRPGAKAKSTHAVATPAMRDIEKKMRELMREADALTAQSLSATISSEKRNEIQDKIERISDMLDVLGEDLGQQRKAAGFAKSTHAALPPQTLEAERKPGGGSHSEAVSRKIATLINEGKPQDQAVAIALDLERRGEL